jgi:hypothetical protein
MRAFTTTMAKSFGWISVNDQPIRIAIRLILILFAVVLLPGLASAKRVAPAKVEPVIHDGVRYVAPNDDGRRAYIEAWDVQTNRKLWDLTVFTNRIDPTLEEDVQWVFINSLSHRNGMLVVASVRGMTYQIDLKTRAVTQCDPVSSPSPEAVHELPELIQRAITNGPLAKKYEVAFRLNPFYLRGDFNGDGKIDVAVLAKQRSTAKSGIAIIDGVTNKVTILGAGTAVGNGGDDFEWMDSWQVYPKERTRHAAGELGVSRVRGDALFVSKTEAASALIYWNGKRYVWLQQGD